MKILFVGDILGRAGRRAVQQNLSKVQAEHGIDLTIVNVENAAGGFGVSSAIAEAILKMGADVLTSGNHIWDQKEVYPHLDRQPRLLRPANYPPGVPGHGVWTGESRSGVPVAVLNAQGRVFMANIDCPFQVIQRELERIDESVKVIVVDFHAEATAEKMAFGWYLDGRVSAVIGTHTHIPTADVRVLTAGTAYVTDVGMTGSYDSVIGMRVEESLARFLTGVGSRFQPVIQDPRFSSVIIEVDEASGRAVHIERCDIPAAL